MSHTGIQISETSILVCGGTNDEGYDPRTCLLLVLGNQKWVPFNHTMNEARIHAHSKVNDKKVFVIGGIDSHVIRNCKTSQDIFDLQHPERGWQLESLPSEEDSLCFPSEVILEIPCEWNHHCVLIQNVTANIASSLRKCYSYLTPHNYQAWWNQSTVYEIFLNCKDIKCYCNTYCKLWWICQSWPEIFVISKVWTAECRSVSPYLPSKWEWKKTGISE